MSTKTWTTITWSMNDNINMNSTITWSMNVNINMNSTITWSMNDNINMNSTITWSMNDNINMNSTITWSMNARSLLTIRLFVRDITLGTKKIIITGVFISFFSYFYQ